MPYPGVKPGSAKEKKIERCVKQVMSNDSSKTKSQAIAICRDSIENKGKKGDLMSDIPKNVNINFYGNWWDQLKIEDDAPEVTKSEKSKKGGVKSMPKKDEKIQKKAKDVKQEDEKEDEEEEEKKEEAKAKKVEKKKDSKKEKKNKVAANVEQAADVDSLLKSVIDKIDAIQADVNEMKKADEDEEAEEEKEEDEEETANAEGAADEEAPEGEEEEPSEEVASKEDDASSGEAESLSKFEGALNKVAESMEKFTKKVTKLEKRLTKLEEQPMPSKVASRVTVSKADATANLDEGAETRLKEIEERLKKYEEIRESNLDMYQAQNMSDKAIKLVYEKERILRGQ